MSHIFSQKQIAGCWQMVNNQFTIAEMMIEYDCSFTVLNKLFQAVNKHYRVNVIRILDRQEKARERKGFTRPKAEYSNKRIYDLI